MNAKQLRRFELHDAQILRTAIDYPKGLAVVDVAYYPTPASRRRKRVSLVFEGVSSVTQVSDLAILADHANAGNVVSWEPSSKPGKTFIHLVNGVIAIVAKRVTVKTRK